MFESPLFWLFAAPGILLGLYAQARIKLNYARYSKISTHRGLTGAEIARMLLDSKGLKNVRIETSQGLLSDHYDPRTKVLRLSPEVYNTPSVAAAGIAAHETGHALQDAVDYFPMEARSFIVPVVQISSKIAPWIFLGGLVLNLPTVAWTGVILFSAQTLFTLITLPVEFDASERARQLLVSQNIVVDEQNVEGVREVLGAAAWTYVAGAVSALGTFVYLIFMLLGSRRR